VFLPLQNITFEGFDDVLAVVEEIGVEEGECDQKRGVVFAIT